MSTPEIMVNDSELVEPPVIHAGRRRSEWLMMLREAWRMSRTKIGVAIFGFIVLLAVVGPWVAPYSPTEFVAPPFSPPDIPKMWLGSDYIGHDVLTRVLYGGRTVILLGPRGHRHRPRPRRDTRPHHRLRPALDRREHHAPPGRRPGLPADRAGAALRLHPRPAALAHRAHRGHRHAPRIARVARASTLEVSQRDFVRAAEAFGIARCKILFNEIMPSITSPLLVEFGLRLTYSIGLIAALSYLGFGMQPPAADWGLMINENQIGVIIQPWPVVVPVLLIGILTIGTNLIADGLGRALIGIERDTGVG